MMASSRSCPNVDRLLAMDLPAVRRRTYVFGAILFLVLMGAALGGLLSLERLSAATGLTAYFVVQFATMVFVGVRLRYLAVIEQFQLRESPHAAESAGPAA